MSTLFERSSAITRDGLAAAAFGCAGLLEEAC